MNVSRVKEILDSYNIEPKIILDIGANIGQFYNEWTDVYNDQAIVISIEANEHCIPLLSNKNSNCHKLLLSDSVKKNVPFYQTKSNVISTGDSLYLENTKFYNSDTVKPVLRDTTTLDNFLLHNPYVIEHMTNGTMNIDLIKMDVQGSELDIMKGGIESIYKYHVKALLLEVPIEEYNIGAPTREEIEDWMLTNIGPFTEYEIDDNYHPITGNLVQKDVLYILSI